MSIRSPNNYCVSPLGPNNIYLGNWDSCLNYATAILTVYTDTNCELTIFQSVDRVTTVSTTAAITGGVPYAQTLSLQYPHLKCYVRNLEAVAQTYLTFEVIYRETSVGGGGGTIPVPLAVNISDSLGNQINSFVGKLQVQDVTAEASLASIDSKIGATRGGQQIWNTPNSLAGGVSSDVDLSIIEPTVLTFFGNVSADTVLTVQMSDDKDSWFSSQYTYTITSLVGGDWGFSISSCPKFVRLMSDNDVAITAYINWS